MKNKTFRRALVCLAHPLSFGAILLLLLNDHVLRRQWPSWWTGKIGDVAWLIFAPFVLAVLLAWVLPTRTKRQEEWVGFWAIAIVGLIFSLANTLPAFHTLMGRLIESLLGCTSRLCRDPSDLVALPSLLVAWRLWKHQASRTHQLSHLKWVALVLATLSTVANHPPPVDDGIFCLQAQDGTIVAISGFDYSNGSYSRFLSQDGGLTWQTAGRGSEPLDCFHEDPWILTSPDDPAIQYRFTSGASIELSEDGGETWHKAVQTALSEAQVYYYYRLRTSPYGVANIAAGPLNALFHRPTGNLVVAMGHEGVLIRTWDREWRWVAVDSYARASVHQARVVPHLLSGEIVYALCLAFLTLGILARHTGKVKPFGYIVLALGWLVWIAAFTRCPPAVVYGTKGINMAIFVNANQGIIGVITVFVGIKAARELIVFSPRALGIAAGVSLGGGVLFLLPYVLWSQGAIPHYNTATAFAALLVFAAVVAGDQYLRHLFAAQPPALQDAEEPMASHAKPDWRFAIVWALANGIGFGLGQSIIYFLSLFSSIHEPVLYTPIAISTLIQFAFIGVIQWAVIQHHFPRIERWHGWVIAAVFGGGMGNLLTMGMVSGISYLTPTILLAIILSLAIGLIQWLVLRRQIRRAGWWVVANLLGWVLSMAIVESLARSRSGFSWLLIGFVYGAITAPILTWILRHSTDDQVTGGDLS